MLLRTLTITASIVMLASSVHAQTPQVRIFEQAGQRCITSNGVPNHAIGQFPNSGNPNRFRTQELRFCFDKNPKRNSTATERTPNVGIALNGIVIRPGTADWYDQASPRGFSRDRSSGWNLEGMGSARDLGMDANNAHVDNLGLYHYHGPPLALIKLSKDSHVGYAADGFEIHYVGSAAKPSFVLKKGNRPTAPGGPFDGRFLQDWEYKKGSGNLDRCNGGLLNGSYVYFATDEFPFYPRCHWGNVSADFHQRGARPAGNGGLAGGNNRPAPGGGPLAAAAAELGISERALADAVGPPPPDIRRAAKILGIPESRLHAVMRKHRPR